MAGEITEEEFRKWKTLPAALAMLARKFGGDWNAARRALIGRLEDGFLVAYAENGIGPKVGNKPREQFHLAKLSPDAWDGLAKSDYLSDSDVWRSGDMSVFSYDEYRHPHETRVYGIRIHPEQLTNLVGEPDGTEQKPTIAPQEPIEQDPKAPPLAPRALAVWYEAYTLAYTENERTLEHAWDRAKRAFPDKTVTRRRIEELRGPTKRGPKPKS